MDEVMRKVAEIARLTMRQTYLALQIADLKARDLHFQVTADLHMHRRDFHQQYWDHEVTTVIRQGIARDLAPLTAEFEKNQVRLRTISEELGFPVPA